MRSSKIYMHMECGQVQYTCTWKEGKYNIHAHVKRASKIYMHMYGMRASKIYMHMERGQVKHTCTWNEAWCPIMNALNTMPHSMYIIACIIILLDTSVEIKDLLID